MTGVYFLLNNKKVVYIGATDNWPVRLAMHKAMIFDEVKLMQCPKDQMFQYERRLIKIFNPKHNIQHTFKAKHKKITEAWLRENEEMIRISLGPKDDHRPVAKKAMMDLKYSPRTVGTDVYRTIVFSYSKLFGVKLEFNKKKNNYVIAK